MRCYVSQWELCKLFSFGCRNQLVVIAFLRQRTVFRVEAPSVSMIIWLGCSQFCSVGVVWTRVRRAFSRRDNEERIELFEEDEQERNPFRAMYTGRFCPHSCQESESVTWHRASKLQIRCCDTGFMREKLKHSCAELRLEEDSSRWRQRRLLMQLAWAAAAAKDYSQAFLS